MMQGERGITYLLCHFVGSSVDSGVVVDDKRD